MASTVGSVTEGKVLESSGICSRDSEKETREIWIEKGVSNKTQEKQRGICEKVQKWKRGKAGKIKKERKKKVVR